MRIVPTSELFKTLVSFSCICKRLAGSLLEKVIDIINMNNLANSTSDGVGCKNNIQNHDIDSDTCKTCKDGVNMNEYLRNMQEHLEMQLQTVDEKFETQGTKLLKRMFEDDLYTAEQLQEVELERALSRQKESLHNTLEETAQAIECDEQNLKFQIDEAREVMSECLGSIQPTSGTENLDKVRIEALTEEILQLRQKESGLQLQKKEIKTGNMEVDNFVSASLTTLKNHDADKAIEILKKESMRLRRMLVYRMERNTALMVRSREQKKEKFVRPSD